MLDLYAYFDIGLIKEAGSIARIERGFSNWVGVREAPPAGQSGPVFDLEARFAPDTGLPEDPDTLLQGESTVGYASPRWGTLRLGRALTPLWAQKWAFDPWNDSCVMGSLGNYNGDFDSDGLETAGYRNYARADHALFYDSPSWSGWTWHLSAQTQAEGARSRGMSLNFTGERLSAMFAAERNHRGDAIVYAAAQWHSGAWSWGGSASAIGAHHSAMLVAQFTQGRDTWRAGAGALNAGQRKASAGYARALSPKTNLYADVYVERLPGLALGMNLAY